MGVGCVSKAAGQSEWDEHQQELVTSRKEGIMRKQRLRKIFDQLLKKISGGISLSTNTVRDSNMHEHRPNSIYLNFSNMQNYKQAMVDDVFRDTHETKRVRRDTRPYTAFWQDYYVFASRNRNLFRTFLNDIGCGPYIKERSLLIFKKQLLNQLFFNVRIKAIWENIMKKLWSF